jgi:small subunit ribosomal protein S16
LLRIRLARTGAKKKGSYRVVAIEREMARDGRFVEILGHYNPRRNPAEVVLKRDRIEYWLGRGAQPSETVRSLLKKTAQAQS